MSAAHRAWFALVGLFAAWVGFWGYAAPAEVARALPWPVPPMHARFIASMYLAGAVAMAMALPARTLASVRIPIVLATVWTGALFAVSLVEWRAFDFARVQAWFWMGAYAVYPLWGAWLYARGGAGSTGRARPTPDIGMVVVAVGCIALAGALFAVPVPVAAAWPWKVSPLLARVYAGPFLAWGVAAALLAREAQREARRIVLVAMIVFTLLALAASALHLALFRFDAPAAWVWFGGLALWAVSALRSLLTARR